MMVRSSVNELLGKRALLHNEILWGIAYIALQILWGMENFYL